MIILKADSFKNKEGIREKIQKKEIVFLFFEREGNKECDISFLSFFFCSYAKFFSFSFFVLCLFFFVLCLFCLFFVFFLNNLFYCFLFSKKKSMCPFVFLCIPLYPFVSLCYPFVSLCISLYPFIPFLVFLFLLFFCCFFCCFFF